MCKDNRAITGLKLAILKPTVYGLMETLINQNPLNAREAFIVLKPKYLNVLQRHYVLISKPHKPALFYDFKPERKIPEDMKLIIIVLKLNLKLVAKKLCTNITPIQTSTVTLQLQSRK